MNKLILLGHCRHEMTDSVWERHRAFSARQERQVGRDSKGRLFINANAVFWIFRIGAPWRDLPPDHSDWKNTHRRFCRLKDKGIWISILSEPTFKEMGSV